jgi:hypothetical protein
MDLALSRFSKSLLPLVWYDLIQHVSVVCEVSDVFSLISLNCLLTCNHIIRGDTLTRASKRTDGRAGQSTI